jgi:hypothetical protein
MAGTAPPSDLPEVLKFGRYFTLVNGLSSLLLVSVPLLLVAAGAPASAPRFRLAFDRIGDAGWPGIAAVVIASVAIGLAVQPLQFGFTQLLEGYWGTNAHAQRAMTRSTNNYVRAFVRLTDEFESAQGPIDALTEKIERIRTRYEAPLEPGLLRRLRAYELELVLERTAWFSREQESGRALALLPAHRTECMPTRLGNVLRRYERLAGAPFGFDGVVAAPYIGQVAEPVEQDYLDDARTSMDVVVRMVLVWSLLTAVETALLWRFGAWLLLPVVTFFLAYMSYRGAVANAVQYGTILVAVTALARWNLYDRMGLRPPRHSGEERRQNGELNRVLRGFDGDLTYRRPNGDRSVYQRTTARRRRP